MIVLKVLRFVVGIPFVLQLVLWLDHWVGGEPLGSPSVVFWGSIGAVVFVQLVLEVLGVCRKRVG